MLRSSERDRRVKRAADVADTIGADHQRGTQMMHVKLDARNRRNAEPVAVPGGNVYTDQGVKEGSVPVIAFVIAGACILIVLIVVIAFVVYKRRGRAQPAAAAATKGRYTGGKHIVTRKRGSKARTVQAERANSSGYSSSDGSEVWVITMSIDLDLCCRATFYAIG